LIAFRFVADEHLAERGVELLDVLDEVIAVLEVELRLAALLGGARPFAKTVRRRVAKDGGAELLIDEDAGFILGDPGCDGVLEAVVEITCLAAAICASAPGSAALHPNILVSNDPDGRRQDVQVPIESDRHRTTSRSPR